MPEVMPQTTANSTSMQRSSELKQENALNQQQNNLGEREYNETHPGANVPPLATGDAATQEHPHGGNGPQVQIDTTSRLGTGPMLILAVITVVLGIFIFTGIHRRATAESSLKTETNVAAIPTVAVTHPTEGAVAQDVQLPADTQAFTDTAIYSRTNGYLLKWYADIGTNVRKGQLLAVIQTPEVDQQVQQAQADVATAKANEQLAETTNERWKALLAKNAVSRQEADQTSSDLLVKQSALNASEANFRRLQQLQSFEHIYAPFDGVITARNVDVGSLIQAGDSNTPHSELFHLNSVGTLRLFVPVPEVYVGVFHTGEQVKVTSDAYPGETFFGTIVRNAHRHRRNIPHAESRGRCCQRVASASARSVRLCASAGAACTLVHDVAFKHNSFPCRGSACRCGAGRSCFTLHRSASGTTWVQLSRLRLV